MIPLSAKCAGATIPPAPCFVILNIDNDPVIEQALPRLLAVLQASVGSGSDFARIYGSGAVNIRVGALELPGGRLRPHVSVLRQVPRSASEIAINIRTGGLPEAPDAAAYHAVTAGVPDIELGTANFTGLFDGADALCTGADHELKEVLGDAGANGWKDDGAGHVNAEELCDAVQDSTYAAPDGSPLSNFLLPSAWIPGAPGPWDYMGLMSSANDWSHGYAIQAESPIQVVEASAVRHGIHVHSGRLVYATGAHKLSAAQRRRKAHPWSRTFRRGVRL